MLCRSDEAIMSVKIKWGVALVNLVLCRDCIGQNDYNELIQAIERGRIK
jgi:hypothetical protein